MRDATCAGPCPGRAGSASRSSGSSTTAAHPGQSPPGCPRWSARPPTSGPQSRTHDAHAVLVAGGSVATETTERVYRDLQELPVDLHLSTGVLGVAASRVAVQRFDDVPVLGLRRAELSRWQALLKRLFDVVVAGLLALCLSPILLGCALAVRLSGPGSGAVPPAALRQGRRGHLGAQVPIHDRRRRGAAADAAGRRQRRRRPAVQAAPRPPGDAGRPLLRAWSLDELPQLFDVLRGTMSLVGPRPFVTSEVDLPTPGRGTACGCARA